MDPITKDNLLDKVGQARARYANLRADFDERVRRMWLEEQTVAQSDLVRAVFDARDAGISVLAIAKAYGTTNRNTIYDLIRERPAYVLTPEPTPESPAVPEHGLIVERAESGEIVIHAADDEMFAFIPRLDRTDRHNYGGVVDTLLNGATMGSIKASPHWAEVTNPDSPVWAEVEALR